MHSESAFQVFDRSTKNIVGLSLSTVEKSTSEKQLTVLACMLTNTHKVTIDLDNFLETLVKAYVKVAEI